MTGVGSKIKQLIERRERAEQELSDVKAEIAALHGETDESLDPDPGKAKAAEKAPAAKKTGA